MLLLAPVALALVSTFASGPKQPSASAEQLKDYKYPSWFRDAKFGIWAHWGPQSVPGQGDWFARRLYIQGDPGYTYHLDHYGHPSKTGYKDLIPLWKAEKWDPDRLMALYKKAGARYFVSMGVHHDNFDLWNSHFHRWNAVNMGPHSDVVATWQRAAKKLGLKFGVSEHLGASFTWFQPSHGADKTGPLAGVPYDGADPRNWDLYHQPAKPGDTGWYSNNPVWQAEWKQRIYDLIDNYHPDLLYTDGGVPFGDEVGYGMIDHFYHSGRDIVYTCKQPSKGLWVEDFERGVMRSVSPYPFQTDTSIGDWFYNVNWKFRDLKWVVHTLLDDVSKNGNLLLNVVQHPDGSLDPEVLALLSQMADWISVNGEGIYGSRPWVTFGEGRVKAKGGSFGEDFAYTGDDIRFTTRGGKLYAYLLGWPSEGKVNIRSLAKTASSGTVTGVSLMGYEQSLKWKQDGSGLHVDLPSAHTSSVAIGLRISGGRLRDFSPADTNTAIVEPDSSGNLVLKVSDAQLNGSGLQVERAGDRDNIGYWDSGSDWVSWKVRIPSAGIYRIELTAAAPQAASVDVVLGQSRNTVSFPATGSFSTYGAPQSALLTVGAAGVYQINVKPLARDWHAINLADIRISRQS